MNYTGPATEWQQMQRISTTFNRQFIRFPNECCITWVDGAGTDDTIYAQSVAAHY
jgi:hypothetical protein